MLLTLANQIRKHNNGYVCKDPDKRPVVLLITMENSVSESVERLFNMTVTNKDIRDFSTEEVIHLLKTEGEFVLDTKYNIDIMIKYYPNKSISTNDLYSIMEDLEDEGYETICLILDYIKRIRSVEKYSELRLELGAVIDELHTLAQARKIPIITASQLNREGARAVDAAIEGSKSDLARLLGKANVGESWNLIENSDWACIINMEYSTSKNRWYLTFKRIKIRFREISEMTYFNQPFEVGNKMKLLEDEGKECLAELSLGSNVISISEVNKKSKRNAMKRENIDYDDEDDTTIPDNLIINELPDMEEFLKKKCIA